MVALAEHDSEKAARILAAAGELVLKRGVKGLTVAEIAERAHVGKGTAYLYWSTKEDLLLGLFARDFLATAENEIDALTTDPDLVRPCRLVPRLVRGALDHPFVRALHSEDADLLGALARDPRTMGLLDLLGPASLMKATMPIWRRHGLARTDWAVDDQAYALYALTAGFLDIAIRAQAHSITAADPDKVIAAAVTALLGPEKASRTEVQAAADEGTRLLRRQHEAVLALITTDQEDK